MKLKLLPMLFSVCQVGSLEGISLSLYTFLSRTEEEISLVCPMDQAPKGCLAREDHWRCFQVEGVLDFSLVGILAGIAGCLAARKIPIFASSTYNTDYIWVKEAHLEKAILSLRENGYEITA